MKNLLTPQGDFQARVSSVLNRNVKEFGKKYLFDGHEDTCWNSEQGTPQWIHVELPTAQPVSALQIMFQGGFVGQACHIETEKPEQRVAFYPEDTNKLQTFPLEPQIEAKSFKIVFAESTDFFGRVTIYQLNLISPDQ